MCVCLIGDVCGWFGLGGVGLGLFLKCVLWFVGVWGGGEGGGRVYIKEV